MPFSSRTLSVSPYSGLSNKLVQSNLLVNHDYSSLSCYDYTLFPPSTTCNNLVSTGYGNGNIPSGTFSYTSSRIQLSATNMLVVTNTNEYESNNSLSAEWRGSIFSSLAPGQTYNFINRTDSFRFVFDRNITTGLYRWGFGCQFGSFTYIAYTPYIANPGQLVTLSGTWDGSILRIYVNGILYGTTTPDPGSVLSSTSTALNVGSGIGSMEMLKVRVYNRCLSAMEIKLNSRF